MRVKTSPFFEIALVLVRLDHVARRIVNADHSINVMGCRTSATKNISAELGAKSTLRLGLVCLKTSVGKSPLGIADVCS